MRHCATIQASKKRHIKLLVCSRKAYRVYKWSNACIKMLFQIHHSGTNSIKWIVTCNTKHLLRKKERIHTEENLNHQLITLIVIIIIMNFILFFSCLYTYDDSLGKHTPLAYNIYTKKKLFLFVCLWKDFFSINIQKALK